MATSKCRILDRVVSSEARRVLRRALRSLEPQPIYAVAEPLDPRMMLTGVHGTVYVDLHNSGVDPSLDAPLAGATLFQDDDGTGIYHSGEASATSDEYGNYSFASLPAGSTIALLDAGYLSSTGEATVPDASSASIVFGATPVPPAPTDLAGAVYDDSVWHVSLSWSSSNTISDVDYVIDRASPGSSLQSIGEVTGTYFDDNDLSPGTIYSYVVYALDHDNGLTSSDSAATTIATTPASNLTAGDDGYGGVSLSWQQNVSVGSWEVEREQYGDTSYSIIGTASTGDATYDDPALSSGAAYSYQIVGEGTAVDPTPSPAASITTGAPPLSGLTAIPVGSTEIDLSWTDNAPSDAMLVVDSSTDDSSFTPVTEFTSPTTAFQGYVSDGSSLYFQVTAVSPEDESQFFVVGGASAYVPLQAPSSLEATVDGYDVSLAWNDNSSATNIGFEVDRADSGGGFQSIGSVAGDGASSYSFDDESIGGDGEYTYVVLAENSLGASGDSNAATVSASESDGGSSASAPDAPYGLAISADAFGNEVSWQADDVPTGWFEIDRADGGSDVFHSIGYVSGDESGGSFYDDDLSTGQSYAYEVIAGEGSSASAPSSPVGPVSFGGLAAFTTVTATATGPDDIELSWTYPGEVANFIVERENSGDASFSVIGDSSGDSYSDTSINDIASYSYQVQAVAVTTSLTSGPSGGSGLVSDSAFAPAAPAGLAASAVALGEIDLSWSYSGDADSFIVEREASGDASFSVIADVSGAASFADTGIADSSDYNYEVAAVSGGLTSGPSSGSGSVSDAAYIASPTSFTATAASDSEIDLYWSIDGATSPTSIEIHRSTDGANFTLLATLEGSATTYADTGLTGGTEYYYEIYVISGGQTSAPAAASATTDPSSPTGFTASAADAYQAPAVSLTWVNDSNGVADFVLERSDPNDALAPIATIENEGGIGTTLNYLDSSAGPGTPYDYQVIAVGTAGGTSAPADTSAFTPIDDLSATANGSSEVDLAWSEGPGGASEVDIYRDGSLIDTVYGAREYADTNVTDASSYAYSVIAVNATSSSAPSNEAEVVVPLAPPYDLSATVTDDTSIETVDGTAYTFYSNISISLDWSCDSAQSPTYQVYGGTYDEYGDVSLSLLAETSNTSYALSAAPGVEMEFEVESTFSTFLAGPVYTSATTPSNPTIPDTSTSDTSGSSSCTDTCGSEGSSWTDCWAESHGSYRSGN